MMDPVHAADTLRAAQAAAGHAWASAWAAWVVGLLAIVVNGFGLYLLREQLLLNKDAVSEAAKGAKAAAEAATISATATRPWMKVSVAAEAQVIRSPLQGRNVQAVIDFTLENVGSTPAVGVSVEVGPNPLFQADLHKIIDGARSTIRTGRTFFPGEKESFRRSISLCLPEGSFESAGWGVYVVCFYSIPGATAVSETVSLWGVVAHRIEPPADMFRELQYTWKAEVAPSNAWRFDLK